MTEDKSVWKRDANEVMEGLAIRYVKFVLANPLVLIGLSVACVIEFAAIYWFLGRGWAIAMLVLSVLGPVLGMVRRRGRSG